MPPFSSRLAVAVHVLSLLATESDRPTTSDALAASIGTNPVVVRRITKRLADAGLIRTRAGVGGSVLTKPTSEIRLCHVYAAVEDTPEGGLFAVHDNPNPNCPIGRGIVASLGVAFGEAQRALDEALGRWTLADVLADLAARREAVPSES